MVGNLFNAPLRGGSIDYNDAVIGGCVDINLIKANLTDDDYLAFW
ncbi:hypothetical protein ES703_88429 [subsurface metagenome]